MSYFGFINANRRWLAGGFLLTMFSSFGQTFFIALSTGNIREEFGLTSGEYGSIYMIATLASAMVFPFVGQIVDKLLVARVVIITIIGLALASIALAKAQSVLWLVLSLFGLRLFGQGMMTHVAITAMGRWYAENRGKSVSIASLGFTFGQAVFPVMFVTMVGLVGWRDTWFFSGVFMLMVTMPVTVALMRVERKPQGEFDGMVVETVRQWTRSELIRDPLFWLVNLGLMAPPFIGTAIFFHQDYLLASRDWSIDLFAWSFIWLTIVSVVTSILSGIVVDRLSTLSLLPYFLLSLGLGVLILALVDEPVALFLFMTFMGMSTGILTLLYGSLWPEIYGTKHLGSIRSLVTALMVLFSALGPGAVGWLIDFGVPLTSQFIGFGVYCFLIFLLMLYCASEYKQRILVFELRQYST